MRRFVILCFIFSGLLLLAQDYNKKLPDPNIWTSNPYDTLILDSLLIDANKAEKPLLLYFFGNNNVNSYKFNDAVFSDQQLNIEVKNHFYPVLLDVASREPIPEKRNPEVDGIRHIIHMGKRNMQFQQMLTGTAIQPYFVIIDLKGNVISKHEFHGGEHNLKELFIEFLKAGFAACEK